MHAEQWLLLTDYASKYRVSVSTLRRRIKNNQINFRFEGGKYFIHDVAPGAESESPAYYQETLTFPGIRPSAAEAAPVTAETEAKLEALRFDGATIERERSAPQPTDNKEPVLSSATRLLNELKRAYTNILQQKEEQIIHLKEEVSDLKTLVRVLEDDNDRMRKILGARHPSA